MGKRRSICRGSIVLRGKKPVLVLGVDGPECLVVQLIYTNPPYHRSDVDLGGSGLLLRNRIARAARVARVARSALRRMAADIGPAAEADVLRVEAAVQREMMLQTGEQISAGTVRSSWRPPKWGDCGRKIGGAPSD